MTRPAWHGVKRGDRVRFRLTKGWWTVVQVHQAGGVAARNRTVRVAQRINAKHSWSDWLTDIVERRAAR